MLPLAPFALSPILTIAVGDVMLGSDYPNASYLPPRGVDTLRSVAPTLRAADLTVGTLEGPLTVGGATGKGGPNSYAFRSPPAYAARLAKAGFDVMTTANNHAGDFGVKGRTDTRAVLTKVGIAAVGLRDEIATRAVKGVTLRFVAIAFNPVSDDVNATPAARALVSRAKRMGGIVVVPPHRGAEGAGATRVPLGPEIGFGERRGDPRRFARAVIEAGADLVVGSGPQVPRAMKLLRGRLVAYSLGNFATYGRFGLGGATSLAPILLVKLSTDGRFMGGRIVSARLVGRGIPKLDPTDSAAKEIARLTRLDFPTSALRTAPDGSLATRR